MFDRRRLPEAAVDVENVASTLRHLSCAASAGELVDQIASLETLKAAAAAAQARLTEALDVTVRADRAAHGRPAAEQGRGIAAEVALARRESPSQGGQHLGLATALVREMPHTLAALEQGRLSEWRATILVRETAVLSREDRAVVDAELCRDPRVLDGLGDRAVAAAAAKVAYRLDPHSVTARASRAAQDRGVSLRPAPDVMSRLSALFPVTDGVATIAALRQAADAARAAGDPRSRQQVMADTLVERVTGRSRAEGVDVVVGLVMTDRAAFDGDPEPVLVRDHGPVPAPWARDLLAGPGPRAEGAPAARVARAWLRRLWTDPVTDELVAMESKAHAFPPALRGFLVHRDQVCRTPWCDAPVRHADHVVRVSQGGPTSADNGQGLCESCNYTKELPGWSAGPAPGSRLGRHRVLTTTPTGRTYVSRPPPLPAARPPRVDAPAPDVAQPSRLETELAARFGHAA
ncbi:MAG TPA: DUF222 domain-containing protein [Actinomycetes bacterium]|nr:DUF222 domain-containing protein [Actinomycetes bacterium]